MEKRKSPGISLFTILPSRFQRIFSIGRSSRRGVRWETLPKYLTIGTTASILGVHPNTLRLWDDQGRLRAVRFGTRRDRRYQKDAVARLWQHLGSTSPSRQGRKNWPMVLTVWRRREHRRAVGMAVAAIAAIVLANAWTGQRPVQAQGQAAISAVGTCAGWNGADHVQALETPGVPTPRDFTSANSAVYRADDWQVVSRTSGVSVGSFDRGDATLRCRNFRAGSLPGATAVRTAQLAITAAQLYDQNSTDTIVVEASLDGTTWATVGTLSQQPGQFQFTIDLPAVKSMADVAALTVRLVPDVDIGSRSQVWVDSLKLLMTPDVPARTNSTAQRQVDRLTEFSQEIYDAARQPFLTIPKRRPHRNMFFVTTGYDEWELRQVKVIDSRGREQTSSYSAKETADGQSAEINVKLDVHRLPPGKYTVRMSVLTPAGTEETIEKEFLWGVVAMNFQRATPAPGQNQRVSIGLLDNAGITICDADISVKVTDRRGKIQRFQTSDKTITRNSTCAEHSVTNDPDYSFLLKDLQSGVSSIHLEAQTRAGLRRYDETFLVSDTAAVEVDRYDSSSRIYPLAPYDVRFAVTPRQDGAVTIEEPLSPGFIVKDVFPAGEVIAPEDESQPVRIRWTADLRRGQTYYFRYTYDAPNISPALFTLGPLKVTDSGDGRTIFQEPRQWQIASDAPAGSLTGLRGHLTSHPATPDPKSLRASKSHFNQDETLEFTLPKPLTGRRGKLAIVSLIDAHGESSPVDVSDSRETTGPLDLKIDPPADGYQPGRYTAKVEYASVGGAPPVVDEVSFAWGVLVVNAEKSIYHPGETAKLDLAVLDATGKTLCQADLDLTVTSPSGAVTNLSTADNTITHSYDCDVHSVTDNPDYLAEYKTTEVGTYTLHLTSTMSAGQARTGSDDSFSIDDSFEVRDNVAFDISRSGTATRLYPMANYTARFSVTPAADYVGDVVEKLPTSFNVVNVSNGGSVLALAYTDQQQEVRWTVDWHAGQTYSLSYEYDPPSPSPRVYPLGPLQIGEFSEARSWQLAVDATRVWDGGDSTANWSVAANWDSDTLPATDDTIVFDGSAGGTPDDSATWDDSLAVSQIASLTVSTYAGTLTLTKTPVTITGAFSDTAANALTYTSSLALTVGANYTLTAGGTFTPNTSTVTLTGTSNTLNTNKTHSTLAIDPSSTGTITMSTNSFTVGAASSGSLTVAANDTLSIDTSLILTLGRTSGTALTLNGTISGAGTLYYQSGSTTFPSGGTISTPVTFNVSNGNITLPARTFGGAMRVTSATSTGGSVLPSAGTLTITGAVTVDASSTGDTRFDNRTGNGNISLGGASCGSGTTKRILMGTGAITSTGTYDLSSCTTASAFGTNSTLTMSGAGTNINLGTVGPTTLVISAGGTVTMTGGATPTNLTTNNGATLAFGSQTLTMTGTFTSNGILSGASGLLIYQSTANWPATGTVSVPVRLDNRNGNITVTAGTTFGGAVTVFNGGTSASRSVILGGATTFSDTLNVNAPTSQNSVLDGATNNATVSVVGAFTFSKGSTGLPSWTTGNSTWTFGGNVTLTNGTVTVTAGNTLAMNGTGTLTSASNTLQNFTTSGSGTITFANATHTFAGDVTLGSSATISAGTSTVTMSGTKNLSGGSQTLHHLTLSGTPTVTVTDSVNLDTTGTLTIPAGATMSINSGKIVWLKATSGTSLSFPDTAVISGAGTLRYANSTAFVTTGTLNATLSYDATSANQTMANRTYGGGIEAYSNSASARLVYPSANTSMTSLGVNANAGGSITFDATVGSTQNYTITVSGNLSCTQASSGAPTIITGTGAWTMSGDVNFTNCTLTATSGNTVTMNGTSKVLTSASQSLYNLTVSGTVSNGDATAVTNDMSVTGTLSGSSNVTVNGTVSGSGTITMSGGTFENRVGAAKNFGSTSGANDWTFATLTLSNSGASDYAITAATGGSGKIIATTLFQVGKATDSNVTTFDATTNDRILDMAGVTITSKGSLTASNSAAFTVSGDWTNSGTFTHSSGTVTLDGTTSIALNSGCSNTDSCVGQNFNNLEINKTAAGDGDDNVTLTTNGINVASTLTITDGELVQGALNVRAEGATAVSIASAGKWSNVSTGDIKIGGSFANAGLLYLDVQGNSSGCLGGDTDDISFTSVDTTARALSGAGTYTLYDVTADYLNATVAITINGGTDGGHNTGSWTFTACGITVSGTCDQYDQTTDCVDESTAGDEIRVAVNGTLKSEKDTTVDGSWSISAVAGVNSGDVITVFVNGTGDQYEAAAVTVYDGSGDVTGVTLFQRHLTLGSVDNPTVTNANISQYDNSVSGDEDVFYEVSAGNDLTVNSALTGQTDEELYIASGATFRPAAAGGADVTTTHVELVNVWTGDSNAINVAGNWVNSGTFTANTSTVTMNGAAAQTMTTNGQAFNALTLNNTGAAGATDDVTISGALDVNGTLTITDGDLQLATNDPNVTTAGDVSIGTNGLVTKADNGVATWTFDGTAAKTYTDAASAAQNIGLVSITKTDGTPANNKITLGGTMKVDTMTVSASNTLDLASSGYTLELANTATATVLTVSGTLTIGTSTVKYSATYGSGDVNIYNTTYSSLNLNGAETYDFNNSMTVNGVLTVGASVTGLIATGVTLTSGTAGSVSVNATGTISAAGTGLLMMKTGSLSTTGTVSAPVTFDTTDSVAAIAVPVRTYGGNVILQNDNTTAGTFTMDSGSYVFSGTLALKDSASNSLTLDATGGNPTVSMAGFSASGTGTTHIAYLGSGTWTDTGSFSLAKFSDFSTTGTLVMSGTGTFTSNSWTLHHVTLSGTITLTSATHTMDGNLDLTGSTLTVGTSVISMTGAGTTITGGGKTLANLTIGNASGTITLQTSDLTVSSLLTTNAGGGSLTIASGRTLTLSGNSGTTFTSNGTVNGPGTLTYQNSATTFPTGGTLAASLVTRFDTLNGNMVIPARTDYGAIEAFGDSANARTVTLGTAGSQTITTSSYLYVIANAAIPNHITLQGATWDPTLNIGGDFDFTGTGAANEIVTAPDAAATWTVSGNVNLTDGTWTASAETVAMNGTSKTFIGNSLTIKNLTISGTITAQTSSIVVSGTLTVDNTKTLTITGVQVWSWTSGTVTNNGTIQGTGTLVIYNSNLGTGGTLSSNVTFNPNDTNVSVAVPARAFAGASSTVTLANSRTTGTGTITMSGSPTFAGSLAITGAEFANTTINAGSASPTVTGSVTYTDGGGGMTDTLTMGSGTWTVGGDIDLTSYTSVTTTGKLVMNGTGTLTTGGKTLNNLDINSSGTVTLAAATHTVSGNLLLGGSAPTVTGSTISMTGTSKTIDGGGLTLNNLTISGTATLQNTDLTVSGTLQVDTSKQITINTSINLTHSGTTLTLNGTITGAGTLIIKDTSSGPGAAVGSTLSSAVRYDASAGNIASTTLDARTYGGAVEFYTNAAGSPARSFTFPTGTFVFSGAVTTNRANTGTITIDADTSDPTITISGATTIGANTTWSASSSGTFNINGNYTNSGTFTHNSGTVTLAGSATQQDLSGTLSGSTGKFNNLIVTNAYGDGSSTWSVTFAGNAETAATFTAATASTKLRFNAGSTYTFAAINFNGQATSSRVYLRSSTAGTQWNIVAGAGSRTVSNTSVKDSNACSSTGGSIDGSDGTNVSENNNSCWTIATLSVTVTPTTAALGTLDLNNISQAGIISTVTTSAPNGYVSMVKYNNTLTNLTSDTIADISSPISVGTAGFGASTSQAGNTLTQSSPASCETTASATAGTVLTTSFQSFASASSNVTSQATTLCFVAGMSISTKPGSYSSTATIVTTAKF